ncbi:putative bifunctional diguanylate cyclase/phosphodiesterase [Pannonibacter tanglangensis]|uniref:EAL domain-containing protein n=1 Tax=Pannonibacter tanglangensis TaxID=2750084 RepID=A0ABW9ZF85_9HYPH|nr:EAL domain-containing protein [Pannonibacter sp. XCT-34]NBN63333.1 EAL domain-containing protein [Pannonibacter sp. XCT-34]
MGQLTRFFDWLLLRHQAPDLLIAQYRTLQSQVPLLYALLIVNAVAVSFTHFDVAPLWLTAGMLVLLISASAVRMLTWLRRHSLPVTADVAARELRRTVVVGAVLAAAHIAWSLALDAYGGPYERGHVILFVAITVIGCIFCLMSLPQAALMVMITVNTPFLAYYAATGEPVFIAIAMNIFLVCLVIIQVLLNGYSALRDLIRSRTELAEKQAETARLSQENARLAHTDSLTGLPNRRYYFNELDDQLAAASAAGTAFAVAVVDLDRFKPINDTYGHKFGDLLLMAVGQRLMRFADASTSICRLGGDEFGLILRRLPDNLEAHCQDICNAVAEPYMIGSTRVTIGASCGIALFPEAGRTAHELFDRSDYALYNAKIARRGQATLYSAAHERKIRSDRAIESGLQTADLARELELAFQPIFDLRTMRPVGVEALARWNSPDLGPVSPAQFIPLAEKAGLIHRVTLCLFEKALQGLDDLPPGFNLSFNLSAHDLTSRETVMALLSLIGQSRVLPSRLTFELTETAVIRSYEAAETSMHHLRLAGARLALDDFGTGYSSLGYLHRLPIDRVKIDRSFIAGLTTSGAGVVPSIIALCRSMRLDCVVEGIETEAQLNAVRALDCTYGQGFLLGAPMMPAELKAWLAGPDLARLEARGQCTDAIFG